MSNKSTGSGNDLPPFIIAYKPQILKIKLGHFKIWIERRLTEILEGLEDEILWSLVFNYLEDAHKRAKREGPAANPSGGLDAKEIQTALSGFLGPKQSRDFVIELFTLLKKAEENETGIPPEFNLKPKEAEEAAYGIIEGKRREMELSERVSREVKRNEYHNRREYDRHRDDRYEQRHTTRSRSRSRERRRVDSDRYYSSKYYDDRDRDRDRRERSRSRDRGYSRDRYGDYYRERSRERYRDHSHDRTRDRSDYRYRKDFESRSTRDINENRKSPIPSSSPDSPSPCWETSLETAQAVAAPRAPNVQESVPSDLEQALKARALKALAEKNK